MIGHHFLLLVYGNVKLKFGYLLFNRRILLFIAVGLGPIFLILLQDISALLVHKESLLLEGAGNLSRIHICQVMLGWWRPRSQRVQSYSALAKDAIHLIDGVSCLLIIQLIKLTLGRRESILRRFGWQVDFLGYLILKVKRRGLPIS